MADELSELASQLAKGWREAAALTHVLPPQKTLPRAATILIRCADQLDALIKETNERYLHD